jgi:hypothetical protein
MIKREQHWIDLMNSSEEKCGYNIRKQAESNLGFKHSEETKKEISASLKGKWGGVKHYLYGKFGINNPHYGKRRPEETGIKIRLSKLGKHTSEKTRQKMSVIRKGMKFTEEHKRKMSDSLSGDRNPMWGMFGKKHPMFGKKHSEEARRKNSEAKKLWWEKQKLVAMAVS